MQRIDGRQRLDMSRRLYAGNLNFEITDTALREIFARAGGVEHAEVMKDRWTGVSRGFGFVDMMTAEDAEAAIGELDGAEVMGRALRVALAKPREIARTSSETAPQ
jgi:RNA recognition motif-containing protein